MLEQPLAGWTPPSLGGVAFAPRAPWANSVQPANYMPGGGGRSGRFREVPLPRVGKDDTAVAKLLLKKLEEAGDPRAEAAALQEPGMVRRLSFTPSGCRAVQRALETADRRTAARLATELAGSVLQATRSPFGNYVVQMILTVLTLGEVPFLPAELWQGGADLARHEYGCRVLCRLLKYHSAHADAARVVDEVLSQTEVLLHHRYGHHVVECCLEHGQPYQRQRVVEALKQSLSWYVHDKNAVHVVVKALSSVGADQEALTQQLLAELQSPEDWVQLVSTVPGNMVGRALLENFGSEGVHKIAALRALAGQQQPATTKTGRSFCNRLKTALAHGA